MYRFRLKDDPPGKLHKEAKWPKMKAKFRSNTLPPEPRPNTSSFGRRHLNTNPSHGSSTLHSGNDLRHDIELFEYGQQKAEPAHEHQYNRNLDRPGTQRVLEI